MIRGMGLGRSAVFTSVALACTLVFVTPLLAFGLAPHVAVDAAPDTCAMCHRAHTGGGSFGVVDPGSWEMTGSALALGLPSDAGDTQLCYVCHGIDALGSGTPVGGSFIETSTHSLAPDPSAWGPSAKYCSSCHDSHGADDSASGTPYPRLLRSRTVTGDRYFQGSAYCGACHTVRPLSVFDGVSVYEQTKHYRALPDPASGTKIRCAICHEGHGSAIAPLIVSQITSPAVPATETITANDRTLCFACHPDVQGTYPGETTYTASAHAASSVLTTVVGEWAADDAKRRVGECQVCHTPMGTDDGTGAPIASLLPVKGSVLCLTCHDADGPSTTDLAATLYPVAAAAQLELLAGFSPETTTSAFGTLAVWGTDAQDAAPRDIVGPRFYAAEGTSGPIAVGDIDGNGSNEVLVADRGANRLTLFFQDPLKGLSSYDGPVTLAVGGIADHLVIADVIDNTLPEICVISGGTLYVYRYDSGLKMPVPVDTVLALGTDITGLAAGDLDTDGFAELVVTDAGALAIRVLTESTVTPGTLADLVAPIAAKAGVRGPSVGDVWLGGTGAGIEIAVANADEPADHITVYDPIAGTERGSYSVDATPGARPWATLAANVLPGLPIAAGTSGVELAVAVNGGSDLSSVNVFTQLVAGGLDTPLRYDTGVGSATGSLAAGDLDGDTYVELVAGNGGFWSRDAALATAPSVQVFQHNVGQTALLANPPKLGAGGVERAGSAPALVVADIGGVGPSRHPVGAVADAHAVDEAPLFARHVECADCHDPHEATSTVVATAPTAYGLIRGTFGTAVTNTGPGSAITYADAKPAAYEYQTCFKCHSLYATAAGLEGTANVAADTNPNNASVHAVEEPPTVTALSPRSGSFETGWDNDMTLYCIDCHSAAGAPAVSGPHASSEAPVLKSPYLGVAPSDSAGLCYDCHKYTTYYDALPTIDDTGTAASWFADSADGPLHGLHVRDHGFGCASCHSSHGSKDNERLIRGSITYVPSATGGTCVGPCHTGAGVAYTR